MCILHNHALKVLILLGFQRFLFDLRFPQKHISENTLCQRAISFILFWGKVSILLMHESSSKIMKLSFLKQIPFDFPFPQILFFSDFMSLLAPLKALKIRLFSTFQILENCYQIRKKALTVWKFQTIKVILYSKLHFMFSHDFCYFTG